MMNEIANQLIDFNELEIDKEIGKGAFGIVFKGIEFIIIFIIIQSM